MAELVPPAPAAGAVKVKTANIRKHLRRDQAAAARKARSSSLAAGDLAKEKLVSSLSQLMVSRIRHNSGRFRTAKAEGGARNQARESGREAPVSVWDAGDEAGHGGERGRRVLLGRRPCSFLFLTCMQRDTPTFCYPSVGENGRVFRSERAQVSTFLLRRA